MDHLDVDSSQSSQVGHPVGQLDTLFICSWMGSGFNRSYFVYCAFKLQNYYLLEDQRQDLHTYPYKASMADQQVLSFGKPPKS